MAHKELISKDKIFPIIIAGVLCAGIVFRIIHLFFIPKGIPFDLGGLYYEFARQIVQAGFRFPVTIPFYTDGGLPFAYPPLVFFIEAVLIHFLNPDKFLLVNLLPSIFLVMSLFAFYFLTKELFSQSKSLQFFSLMAFIVLPNTYQGSVQASGVVEAFSSIMVIVFMYLTIRLRYKKMRDFILLGVIGGLCVWSSPGSAYAVIYLFIAFALYIFGRRANYWHYFRNLFIAGITVIIVASPYLLTVIRNHSLSIFTNSFLGQHSVEVIKTQLLYTLSLKYLTNIDLLWVLGLVGLVALIRTRHWIIPFWFLSLSLIPRESIWLVGAAGALLIGYAINLLYNFILDGLRSPGGIRKISSWVVIVFCLLFMALKINLIFDDYYAFYKSVENSLPTKGNINSLEWMNQNLPKGAKLIVIVSNNGIIEWAPPITERTVLNVPYGSEFDVSKRVIISIFNKKAKDCQDISCISGIVKESFYLDSYYLLISDQFLDGLGLTSNRVDIDLLYENEDLNLFQVHNQ